MLLVIGAGGVGRALARRFYEVGEKVGLLIRPHQKVEADFAVWSAIEEVPFSEVTGVFLCVKDHQILQTAQVLHPWVNRQSLIIHTAGSVPLSVLSELYGENSGVIYPLQSFVSNELVAWGHFPVFWEGHPRAEKWACILTGSPDLVYPASSEERLRVHIGAVFAANFVNALFHAAERLVESVGDRRLYMPLAETVLRRLGTLSPAEAQTGPARRGDEMTIEKHWRYLREHFPELAEIYQKLTRYIQEEVCKGEVGRGQPP